MNLVIALGNPGRQYENTRHNLGWMTVDELPFCSNLRWKEKFKGEYFKVTEYEKEFVFLRPQTFMNLSGESVRPAMDFFKIAVEDILVIHDELDLPFGTISFKDGGGLAGHNGLKSIAAHVGGQNFKRFRMGIGRPEYGDVSSHVLSPFSSEESALMKDCTDLGVEAICHYMKVGFGKAANKFSKKSIIN